MNTIKYISISALIFCFFTSCKKQSLLTYNSPDNIYFTSTGQPLDSTNFTFANQLPSVKATVFKIPIAVSGTPKDYDRTFQVIVDKSSTAIAGQHYEFPFSMTVRAGRVVDSLGIKLLRSTDLQNKAVLLKLILQENQNFHVDIKTVTSYTSFINVTNFKLYISDVLVDGKYWSGVFAAYFGAFSKKKVLLINQIVGMPLDYYTSGWLTDVNVSAKSTVWAITMSHYLADQKAAGKTIFEDDGVTEMVMAPAYQ
ncbi:DUF4843 domain-containing protein [Pedobacter sp. R-06]|uniref:DUF4843 domain-containing protein n=1 Tax=Pedobacter sp. R-06 TaxID=3404051 RepID=UPI003CE83EA8